MIRVGIVVGQAGAGWMGGANYITNLLRALHAHTKRGVEPVLIAHPDTPEKALAALPPFEMIRTPLVDELGKWSLLRKVMKNVLGRDFPMERFLRRNNIELLSHSGHLGRHSGIPTIGWIPDFQHRRLPGFFDRKELVARDRRFKRLCNNCTTIVLSSEDAQKDLWEFDSSAFDKSKVLRFVSWFEEPRAGMNELRLLHERYMISGAYFHLPNQFWAHKNHRVVVDALAMLKARGQRVCVIATGHTNDLRQPNFFNNLTKHIAAQGVADEFRVLGLVPYADLAVLMRHSVAVINPSLFEGWSTTVEEAKSMGKKVLLSDIPVHREQAPERGIYFEPTDVESLAIELWKSFSTFSTEEDVVYARSAHRSLTDRIRAFAHSYEETVSDTIKRIQ